MDEKKVDVHLIVTALQLVRREAVRLLGFASIHTYDQNMQQRVFGDALETVVPFAIHCRRLIELTKLDTSAIDIEFKNSLEIDGQGERASIPARLWDALNYVLHSRTVRGAFLKMREVEAATQTDNAWSMAAREAVSNLQGRGCLGSPGFNPWRYSLVLKCETDKNELATVPVLALAETYFDGVEPRVRNVFGDRISKWGIWDVL